MKCLGKRWSILLLILLLAAFCWGCQENSILIGTQKLPLDAAMVDLSGAPLPEQEELEKLAQLPALKSLDLRGTEITLAQYAWIRELLPDCEILWQIPFGGEFLETEVQSLEISALTEADFAALAHFTNLKEIHAEACREMELVKALQTLLPDCRIFYQVVIGGETVPGDAVSLTVDDADPQDLLEKLAYLPALTEVSFAGKIPEREEILPLLDAYPEIHFLWEMEVFGQKVSTDARELDFSGTPMESVEAVEELLPFFRNLEKVILCDCGLSSEELDDLGNRHPEIRFVWTVRVGLMRLRTDITALMPHQHGYHAGAILGTSDCGEMKYLVDLVCLDLGHMRVTDLSFVRHMPNLEYLLVCGNGIRDISPLAGLEKLKYVELFANNITDVSPLASCPALEDVNLCYNRIADVTPLLEMESLKNLWASAIHLPEDQVRILEEELGEKINLQLYQSRSTGGGWRDLPNYFAQRDLLGMPYFTTP